MGRVIVKVMPKPEILDPQGKAVRGAFPRHGVGIFTDVRQGKHLRLSVEGAVTEGYPESARKLVATSLSNPVIEDVVAVYVAEGERRGSAWPHPPERWTTAALRTPFA